jgi:hypothetical protein
VCCGKKFTHIHDPSVLTVPQVTHVENEWTRWHFSGTRIATRARTPTHAQKQTMHEWSWEKTSKFKHHWICCTHRFSESSFASLNLNHVLHPNENCRAVAWFATVWDLRWCELCGFSMWSCQLWLYLLCHVR